VIARVAVAVVRYPRDAGLARPIDDQHIPGAVAAAMWSPAYLPMDPASPDAAAPAVASAAVAEAWSI
jgi:hypothetical protein